MKIHVFLFTFVASFGVLFSFTDGHSIIQDIQEDEPTISFYSDHVPMQFIVVEKSKQQLMLFEQGESLQLLKTFVCSTGENPGKKYVSGDSKTPEGLYFITEIYEDKKITVFGSRAYHLDYPNVFDKHAGHLGDGIFIHGTNKPLIPFSSNGCIVLDNNDLDELADYLKVGTTPIIVLEKFSAPPLGTSLGIEKDGSKFNDILQKLSFSPTDFSTDNIETLSYLTLGSQAIASISYRIYDQCSLKYRYHKRVYLTANMADDWHNLYSVESQDIIPTILALHPVKNQSVEQTATAETATAETATAETATAETATAETATAETATAETATAETATAETATAETATAETATAETATAETATAETATAETATAETATAETATAETATAETATAETATAETATAETATAETATAETATAETATAETATAETATAETATAETATAETATAETATAETATAETALPESVVQIDQDSEVLAFVKKWQTAWMDKDIETYMECYSPSFKNGRLDRKGWKRKKSYLNHKYRYIKVDIKNITIEWTDAGANVTFFQEYRSDQYHKTGTKTLQLINRDNKWMIQKERM